MKKQLCDQIMAKLIKEGGKELKKVIYELISKIWEDVITQEWNYGMIFPIPKKMGGGPCMMMCEKYRAVTLLSTSYIILASIVCVKLVPYAEEIIREYQGGLKRKINCS